MTSPIPSGGAPVPPPIISPPLLLPVPDTGEAVLPPAAASIGTLVTPPADFTDEVLFAMMRSLETTTAAGRPHETLQLLTTLPPMIRHGEAASYFGGMALLQQGRVDDAAAIATAALEQIPDSVPLLLLAAATRPASTTTAPQPPPSVVTREGELAPVPLPLATTPPLIPGRLLLDPAMHEPPPATLLDVTLPRVPGAPVTPAEVASTSLTPLQGALIAATPAAVAAAGLSAEPAALPDITALPLSPVIVMPPSRAIPLLLQAVDLAPRDLTIFARIAAALMGSRERPLMMALFRELERVAPANPAIRALATLLSGNAPPEWNPWARQIAAPELWQHESVAPREALTADPPRFARVVTDLLASGEPAQALVLLELPAAPRHPQVVLLRAEALLQLQRPEAALAVIREAQVRFPEAAQPLAAMAERLLAALALPLGERDARVSVLMLRALAVQLGVTSPDAAPVTSLADAALPLLDAAVAQRSPLMMEARVRLLIASGRGSEALIELQQARDLQPHVTSFAKMLELVDHGLATPFPVRSHQEAAEIFAPLRGNHADLPTLLSLALVERLVHSGEMMALVEQVNSQRPTAMVDFRGPEGTAAGQWLGQFAVPVPRGNAGGALLIVALAGGFVLWIAGRTGLVILWTALCVLVALAWSRLRR
ncbi:MAG: hypothetical protein V4558_08470 [Gemmatimonadota bacterium]